MVLMSLFHAPPICGDTARLKSYFIVLLAANFFTIVAEIATASP